MKRSQVAGMLLAVSLLAGACGAKQPEAKPATTPAPQGQSAEGKYGYGQGAAKDPYGNGQSAPATGQAPVPVTPTAGAGTHFALAAESVASYTVQEKFLDKNLGNTAVGKTSAFTGELVLLDGKLQPSTITVDVSTLKSDKDQRDNRIKNYGLESSKYPKAEYAITGVQGTVPTFAEGKEVAFKLTGNMTIHGTQKPLTFDAKGTLAGGTFKLSATTHFVFADFGMEPPSVLGLISVDDHIQLDIAAVGTKK